MNGTKWSEESQYKHRFFLRQNDKRDVFMVFAE